MTDIGKCRGCKWWAPILNRAVAHEPGWGSCSLADGAAAFKALDAGTPTAKAIAVTGDYYGAELQTRHDYGCVQYTANEAKE